MLICLPLEVYMGTTRKTITLTDQQDRWIKAQIAAGEYTNDSEYIRDLVRCDQEQNAKFRALKAAIQEGLDSGISGISGKTVRDVWEEAEARYRAKNG
jgi:antitoxin ParD1/3/4